MIFNNLEKLEEYCPLDKTYVKAILDFISTCKPDMNNGSYKVKNDIIFANVSSYETAAGKINEFESHQKYVDLQLLLSGEEYIYLSDISHLEIFKPYVSQTDFMLWTGKEQSFIHLVPGTFALFLPEDAHQVGRSVTDLVTTNKKIVFKIAKYLFQK